MMRCRSENFLNIAAHVYWAVSALDEMEKTRREKRGKTSKGQKNRDNVEVLGGSLQFTSSSGSSITGLQSPPAPTVTSTYILLTTNQIEASANTHGHDEECRLMPHGQCIDEHKG